MEKETGCGDKFTRNRGREFREGCSHRVASSCAHGYSGAERPISEGARSEVYSQYQNGQGESRSTSEARFKTLRSKNLINHYFSSFFGRRKLR